MFSTEEFIEASRKFVCIRIETFENKESEALVKKVLRGKIANTSFVILTPDGTIPLTRSGRSPGMVMVRGKSRTDTNGVQNKTIIAQMSRIAKEFQPSSNVADAQLQDFHSLRQALNCASADQRLLVFVNVSNELRSKVETTLKFVFSDEDVIGKFHLNFANSKTDSAWTRVIHGAKNEPSIIVVRSNQFGLDGNALEQISLDADPETIKASILDANRKFAKLEVRKDYEKHVQAGKQQRIFFENEISRRGAIDGKMNRQRRGGRAFIAN